MNRPKLHIGTFLLATVLAALISFSALMCLAEAFSMAHSMLHLLLVCAASALAAAAVMLPKKTGWVTLAALAVWVGVILWLWQPMLQSLLAAVYQITREYASCFSGVAVVGQEGNCLLFLAALAPVFCWITAWVICREGNLLFLLLACLPVFLLCLIIVDLAPVLWLVVLTFGLLLLVMSHGVRERSTREGNRLAWWLVLPSIILITTISILWPPADYTRADWSARLQAEMEDGLDLKRLQKLPETLSASLPRWDRELRSVDLSRLGPKVMNGQVVLNCRAESGSFYLRGVSLGTYSNNSWKAIDQAIYQAEDFSGQPLLVSPGEESQTLQIQTLRPRDVIYTTYLLSGVPDSAQFVDDTYVKNRDRLTDYLVSYHPYSAGAENTVDGYENYVNSHYTQVPEDLRQPLQEILAEKGWYTEDPRQLAAWVRESAVYDLNTPALPNGEEFVLYFLQESNRGYCVHFATATVMLLRAMDIPARYVSGYSVSGTAGEWITVTEDDAHAWVEYYVNGVGWLPLEPTPAAEQQIPVPESQQAEPIPEKPGETPDSPEAEQPAEPEPAEPEKQEILVPAKPPVQTGWLWILLLPAAACLLWLRRWLMLRRWKDRCSRGNPNRRALALWRWLIRIAREDHLPVEDSLVALAQKARFSQHTLEEQEVAQLQQELERRITGLQQQPVRKQLWYQYGLILY